MASFFKENENNCLNDGEIGDGNQNMCKICSKEKSQYTCPRCNIRYCSSLCYKAQGHLQCSEAFYKDCFMEGLKDKQISGNERQEMLAMLSRLEDENPLDSDDDDDEDVGLAERLAGLNLDKDTDVIWERLTEREREEFRTMVKHGLLGSEVEVWKPWWKTQKIKPVEELKDSPAVADCLAPGILKDIPDISQVLRGSPSECISYTVINVLYGYAYVTRLHNGDHLQNCLQATQELLDISDGLGSHTLNTAGEAIQSCVCKIQQNKTLFQSREYSVAIIQDVVTLVQGPGHSYNITQVMAALSDIHKLVSMARKKVNKEKKETPLSSTVAAELKSLRQKYFSIVKKIEFLLGWTNKYGIQLLNCLTDVDLEFCSLSSDLASHEETKEKIEKSLPKLRPAKEHRLIEDITDR